jgi:hypothetical protein
MIRTMPMKPPVFVCSDDVYVFTSKEDAESFLEPEDVEPDEHGYDAEGRLLRVVVRGEVRRGRWSVDQSRARVELVPAEEAASHAEELRTVLVDWLRRADSEESDLAGTGLQELVQRAERVARRQAAENASRPKVLAWLAVLAAGGLAVWWWLIR